VAREQGRVQRREQRRQQPRVGLLLGQEEVDGGGVARVAGGPRRAPQVPPRALLAHLEALQRPPERRA
jgi:hypothetical protein